ncbi:MAG: hypothetical protein CSB34_07110 [Desulfobulbus propionicus]|nr:MAG: hypothetical protein CSB34_07110 [Desulfobulbus propionicus]
MKQLLLTLFLVFFGLGSSITVSAEHAQQPQDIEITLPAKALLTSLRAMLPFPVETNQAEIAGQILITAIHSLRINNNILSLQGVIQGNNVAIATKIAGQNIRLKFGEVNVPITCDLHTRFDAAAQTLYVTPTFPPKSEPPAAASTQPLFNAMGGKEYPIAIDPLDLSIFSIDNRPIPLIMVPTNITGQNNVLTVSLRPQEQKK